MMALGVVKWFDRVRGFGFIQTDELDADVFVHFSGIRTEGFKKLRHGERVEFELSESDKGLLAQNVNVVPSCPIAEHV